MLLCLTNKTMRILATNIFSDLKSDFENQIVRENLWKFQIRFWNCVSQVMNNTLRRFIQKGNCDYDVNWIKLYYLPLATCYGLQVCMFDLVKSPGGGTGEVEGRVTEAYLEPRRTSTMKLFCKNCRRLLAVNYFHKKLHRRCLIGF